MNVNLKQLTSETKNGVNPILYGLTYTFSIVIISVLLLAIILTLTSLSDSRLPYISYAITVISILVGGYKAAKKAQIKGWYYGGITGLIYGLLLVIITFLAFDFSLNLRSLVLVVLTFLFGAFGGIFGVNSKK